MPAFRSFRMRRMSKSANRSWRSRGLPARWQSSKLPSWSWSRRWMSRGNVSVSTWRPRLGFLIKLRKRQKKDGLNYFDLCTCFKKKKKKRIPNLYLASRPLWEASCVRVLCVCNPLDLRCYIMRYRWRRPCRGIGQN